MSETCKSCGVEANWVLVSGHGWVLKHRYETSYDTDSSYDHYATHDVFLAEVAKRGASR